MKCARLHLQERSKPVLRRPPVVDKPRRYCQKRMINPDHSEDPRWNGVLDRFHCNPNPNVYKYIYGYENQATETEQDDLVLTVQNLRFQGDVQDNKRPRTSFKYKSLTANRKHRMFIKQVVDDIDHSDEERSSELTSYYFDNYVKYILSNDRSRPSSSKSSAFLQDLSNRFREGKSTQVDAKQTAELKNNRKIDHIAKNASNKRSDNKKEKNNNTEVSLEDAKVAFHKSGKNKCLTISRAQSPETIQVIRVDVVCNYSTSSAITDHEEKPPAKLDDTATEKINFKSPHFADKYLLTNTVKSVNEKLSCGSKVTLLCKTFKLTKRSKSEKKYNKIMKETSTLSTRSGHVK